MKYFKYSDMLVSDTANKKHINNIPNELEIFNNILTVLEQLDKIREELGYPIIITSGYRCPELNKAVGGVKNSHHLKGLAADIIWNGDLDKLYKLIKSKFKFTQLIHEGTWLHFSYDLSNLKCEAF